MQASVQNVLPETLPDNLDECHALFEKLRSAIIELDAALAEQQARERQLEHQLLSLLKRLYGPRSERIDAAQLLLAFAQDLNAEPKPETAVEESAPAQPQTPAKKNGHGRKPLPANLPRKRIVLDVAEADKTCPECCAPKKRIGEDTTELVEHIPATYLVLEYVRPKYACSRCQEHVSQASAAPRVIEKGLAGPGLVAQVITSKYCDHLPLYRQERILARYGLDFSRQTLCGWVVKSADKLEPLVDAMKRDVLASRVIHTDDTPVRVQDDAKGALTGRLWVYVGDTEHPYIVYDYTRDRGRDGPQKFLDGYQGYLQADAFGGYDGIYATGKVIECACWAHARRKYYDALAPKPTREHRMLAWIRDLYFVEREAKEMDAQTRCALRREKSKPILDTIKTQLDEQKPKERPKSPIGGAIAYTLNNWTALNRYLDDGIIAIDNNAAEQALRGIALGRKNWLFLGSDAGGRAAAIHYSLIQSAPPRRATATTPTPIRRGERDVLLHLAVQPDSDLRELLPDRWKQSPAD